MKNASTTIKTPDHTYRVRTATVGQSFGTCAVATRRGVRIEGDVVALGHRDAAVRSLARAVERAEGLAADEARVVTGGAS